jgi:hypothetical protein
MTYSDCWIDTVDDGDFKALIAGQIGSDAHRVNRIELLPSPPGMCHLWPPIVKEWASEENLSIDYIDPICLQVPVSREQLLQFLDHIFGREPLLPPNLQKLRAHIRQHLRDDRTYLIVADEF